MPKSGEKANPARGIVVLESPQKESMSNLFPDREPSKKRSMDDSYKGSPRFGGARASD